MSFALQLGVTFQQSLVLGNTSHYPVNPSLMIGDYVTPGNGISSQTYRQWSMAKSFCTEYSHSAKQLNDRHSTSSNGDTSNNNKQNRKLVFSSPASKLRLSSAVRILNAVNLANFNTNIGHVNGSSNNFAYINKVIIGSGFGFGWSARRNKSQWEARWRRVRTVLS